MLRRIIILVTGTIAGVFAVVAYHPPQLRAVATVGVASPISTPQPSSTATQKPSPTATKPSSTASTATKTPTKKPSTPNKAAASTPASAPTSSASTTTTTVAGSTTQTRWGPVQVEITVTGGAITSVKALQFPHADHRSQSISQQAIPYLIQQTLTTKSANVVGVSGASYTSDGWRRSLASARVKAGI